MKLPALRFGLARTCIALLVICLMTPTGVSAQSSIPPPPLDWISSEHRNHPLVGKMWATKRGQFLALDLLPREIAHEEFVLLGEIHDNPDHHRLRAWILSSAFATGVRPKPPAVVFEHIRAEQQSGLDQFVAQGAGVVDDLLRLLDWKASGWPDQAMFAPLFEAVLARRLAIVAGDPARSDIRRVSKEGLEAIPPAEAQRLKLDVALEPGLLDALLVELEASHCGLLPKAAFAKMAIGQRYRDAYLAAQMANAATSHGAAILIAGNGHVRVDRGVPWYLRRLSPERKTETVLFIEVEPGRDDPSGYVEKSPDGLPTAEYIVFTPRVARPDPCIEMREMFKKPAKPAN